jgi:signal peptidase I
VRVLVLAAVSFITFKWFFIPIRTQGSSMLPTYGPDRLNLVNRLTYTMGPPTRGDVVAIEMAGPNVLYVKRIIGLPGERIAISEGHVLVNGVALSEPYVKLRRAWNVDEVTLGPSEYFVMGDNRGMSAGEHDFGRVNASRILGKVMF